MVLPRLCAGECEVAAGGGAVVSGVYAAAVPAGAHVGVRLDHDRLPWLGGRTVDRFGGAGAGLPGFVGDSAAHQETAVGTHGDGAGGDLYGCFSGRGGAVGRCALACGGHQALLRPPDVP